MTSAVEQLLVETKDVIGPY